MEMVGTANLYAGRAQGVEWLVGNIGNREMLVARWAERVNDASLRDLPYKVELNAEGTIEMSPANNWHAAVQGHLAHFLRESLPGGMVFTECSILTVSGVRVPDVAWGSTEFVQDQGVSTPFGRAPEICVEVLSPSNSPKEIDAKVKAFLAAGAREVWLVHACECVSFFGPEGVLPRSAFVAEVRIPASIPQG